MSDELLARHKAVTPSWLAMYYDEPIELVRGEGRHVWDADGTRYLDFFGGILTTMVGHAVPEVVDALRRAVTYVAGMTDRFAFATAVRELGYDPALLPRAVGEGANMAG